MVTSATNEETLHKNLGFIQSRPTISSPFFWFHYNLSASFESFRAPTSEKAPGLDVSLRPSSHLCYLSPPSLSICPSCLLITYSTLTHSPSHLILFLCLLSPFHSLSVNLPSWCWEISPWQKPSSLFDVKDVITLVTVREPMQMCSQVRPGPLVGGRDDVLAVLLRRACLFVYHHLSSAVTPPSAPPGGGAAFWTPLAVTVLTPYHTVTHPPSTPALQGHGRGICDLA